MDITNLFDIAYIRKIAKNLTPIIASVTFIYLFIVMKKAYLLILACFSLFFLAFYINLDETIRMVVYRKIGNIKCKSDIERGMKAASFLVKDKVYLATVFFPFILNIVALFILVFNLVDTIAWILLFLYVLALFHYISKFIVDVYVGTKYKKLFRRK